MNKVLLLNVVVLVSCTVVSKAQSIPVAKHTDSLETVYNRQIASAKVAKKQAIRPAAVLGSPKNQSQGRQDTSALKDVAAEAKESWNKISSETKVAAIKFAGEVKQAVAEDKKKLNIAPAQTTKSPASN